jgi:hypothetical protein
VLRQQHETEQGWIAVIDGAKVGDHCRDPFVETRF